MADTKLCTRCGKKHSLTDFAKGFDRYDRDFWCNNCRKKYVKNVNELEEYCRENQREFDVDLWNRCMELAPKKKAVKEGKKTLVQQAISIYFSNMNLEGQGNQISGNNQEEVFELPKIDFKVTPDIILKWGQGYSQEDYMFLETNYQDWIENYKDDTLAERKLYEQICIKELEIKKARQKGHNVDKQVEALQKLMNSANVTPKDSSSANDPNNLSMLGMIIKDIEQVRPCEYFNDKKIHMDFDGLGDYFNRQILRPMKNLLLGTREFDKEFNVEDGGDADD